MTMLGLLSPCPGDNKNNTQLNNNNIVLDTDRWGYIMYIAMMYTSDRCVYMVYIAIMYTCYK